MDRFSSCLAFVLLWEKGYVNHPDDPGGATNMGITLRTLSEWRGKPVTPADVKALERSEAEAIYRARYWKSVKADQLPRGVDLLLFDGAVNSGPTTAARWLQKVLRVSADGAIGPLTLAAATKADRLRLIEDVAWQRVAYLTDLSGFRSFGAGWLRRVEACRAAALAG